MTTNAGRLLTGLLLLATASAEARPMDPFAHAAVMESLRYLPPNMRFREMRRLGLCDRTPAAPAPESTGLRLVGKWGGGPSVKVTGRDSLVFLSRGSEVVAINFADTANPEVLSYMQVNGLVSRSVLVGDRLYVGSTGSAPKYIDVFDVANPAAPTRLGALQTYLNDIEVQDTLVYAIADDSLKVYNFADPANPRLLGACRDSGYHISVSGGYAYVGDDYGLYIFDVRTPSAPRRVASWGDYVISVASRSSICCVTTGNPNLPGDLTFSILDVTNPNLPRRVGSLAAGGYDICLRDTLAFLSGYYTGGHVFRVLSIADSTTPVVIGSSPTPGLHYGVWPDLQRGLAYVADRERGLTLMSIHNLANPTYVSTWLAAGWSEDVAVDGNLAYIASDGFGMIILDVTDPAFPAELGHIDSTKDMVTRSVAARDSFAFMAYAPGQPRLRSIDVTDPMNPVKAGGANLFDWALDMVLRDSLLYIAEPYRFQVVNVARPREPRLVGSCAGDGVAVVVQDSFAYTAAGSIRVTNIARPSNPFVVTTIERSSSNISIVDSLLVCHPGPAIWYSLANPAVPVPIDSIDMGHWITAFDVVNRTLYACSGPAYTTLYAISIEDLHQPRVLAQMTLPYAARRISYFEPYLYVCCWDAGVCILDTLQTGISEQRPEGDVGPALRVWPSVTRGRLSVGRAGPWRLMDVTGKVVAEGSATDADIDLSRLAPGVYFVSPASSVKRDASGVTKVVITR